MILRIQPYDKTLNELFFIEREIKTITDPASSLRFESSSGRFELFYCNNCIQKIKELA